jgi:hypothetical protein
MREDEFKESHSTRRLVALIGLTLALFAVAITVIFVFGAVNSPVSHAQDATLGTPCELGTLPSFSLHC